MDQLKSSENSPGSSRKIQKKSKVVKMFHSFISRLKGKSKNRKHHADDSSDNDDDDNREMTSIFRAKLCQGNGDFAEGDFLEAFKFFDTNGDGKITHSELNRVLKKLDIDMSKQEVKKMITELDKDGSGTIDYNEFAQMMSMPATRDRDEYELREAFKCMDLDGNGFISKEELRNMISNTMQNGEITEAEVNEMMDEADVDGDNNIDFDEFVKILVEKR